VGALGLGISFISPLIYASPYWSPMFHKNHASCFPPFFPLTDFLLQIDLPFFPFFATLSPTNSQQHLPFSLIRSLSILADCDRLSVCFLYDARPFLTDANFRSFLLLPFSTTPIKGMGLPGIFATTPDAPAQLSLRRQGRRFWGVPARKLPHPAILFIALCFFSLRMPEVSSFLV